MPRNFEFRVIVCPHRKQLLLELVRLEDFITLTDFQFKFLPIDIIHSTRISPSRKKNEAKRKSITFSFNFIFIVEQTVRNAPRNTLLWYKVPPEPAIFIRFSGRYCPRLLNASELHYFLLFFPEQCPGPYYIWLRLPRT